MIRPATGASLGKAIPSLKTGPAVHSGVEGVRRLTALYGFWF
jgi:hypothetical protein